MVKPLKKGVKPQLNGPASYERNLTFQSVKTSIPIHPEHIYEKEDGQKKAWGVEHRAKLKYHSHPERSLCEHK